MGRVRRYRRVTACRLLAIACQPGRAPHANSHAGGRRAAQARERECGRAPHLPALGVGVLETRAVRGRALRAHRPARPGVALRQALKACVPRQRPPPWRGSLAGDALLVHTTVAEPPCVLASDVRLSRSALKNCSAASARLLL